MRRALLSLLLLAATCSVAVGFPEPPSSPAPANKPQAPVEPDITTSVPSNETTTTSTKPTTAAPSSTTTSSTTISTTSSSTTTSTTTEKPTTKAPVTTTPTPTQAPTSTPSPSSSSSSAPSPAPKTTVAPGPVTTSVPPPAPSKGRHFDGLSFMGGIILTACLVGLSVGSYKFYKIKTERSYRTL